jgi:hypothetical protein
LLAKSGEVLLLLEELRLPTPFLQLGYMASRDELGGVCEEPFRDLDALVL